jgi:hypothetical protein
VPTTQIEKGITPIKTRATRIGFRHLRRG